MTADLLVKNCLIVTMDARRRIIQTGYIAAKDGIIVAVGEGNPSDITADQEIDASGRIAVPGLISTHTHMYGLLSHGIPITNAPRSFRNFLEKFWWPKVENRLRRHEIEDTARMACVEMARTGTTCFADILEAPYSIPGALEAEAEIVSKSGLRAFLSFEASERIDSSNGEESLQENARFIQRTSSGESLVKGMMCTHTLFTSSLQFLQRAKALASGLHSRIHIHLEESRYESDYCLKKYGSSPVAVYEKIEFLEPSLLASQCVQTSREEIRILAKHDVKVAHMPLSNCEVGGGIAPVKDLLDSGLTVALGTDGFVTDMFEVMRAAFLIHKGHLEDASVLTAEQVFNMATVASAPGIGDSRAVRFN